MGANILFLALAALIIEAHTQSAFNYGNSGAVDARNGQFGQTINQITSLDCVAASDRPGCNPVSPATTPRPANPFFNRNIGAQPASDCETRTSPISNLVTENARPANPFFNRNINLAPSECETRTLPSCNPVAENSRPANPFFNRNINCETVTQCETSFVPNRNPITETSRPLNSFFNRNLNSPCAPSVPECDTASSICNSLPQTATANSFCNRILPFSNLKSVSDITSGQCETKLAGAVNSRLSKRPLLSSSDACCESLQPCSLNEATIPATCDSSLSESLSSRSNRFFNRNIKNLPFSVNNDISTPCDTPCTDSPGTFNSGLYQRMFDVNPPLNTLPSVDNIRPRGNFITETASTSCGAPCIDNLGSCNRLVKGPIFETYPSVNNLPRIEINKRPIVENCQPCADIRPNCNSITETICGTNIETRSFNRPVFETFPVNNINSISCGLPKVPSCDTIDNVNPFIRRLPNNPFNRPCLETATNFNSVCNCNQCTDFGPCFQQGFPSIQAPILPSLNSQIPNVAVSSAVDNNAINSLADSIQLLVVANLIQNSMYLNSLSRYPCSNTDVLGSVQCVLDNAPACSCSDIIGNTCGCVDVNPCNNVADIVTPCDTGVQEVCGSWSPYAAGFGCQGFPDVVTSILNCRGKPLPDVLTNLLGYPRLGDFGGQCGCSGLIDGLGECGCSTLPQVLTPCDGCAGLPDAIGSFPNIPNFFNEFPAAGFSGFYNLPQWNGCGSDIGNVPCGILPQFIPQGFQGCNYNLPEVMTPFGMCNGVPDIIQPIYQVPAQQGCGFQGNAFGIGGCALPEVGNCGYFPGVPDIQVLPQIQCGFPSLPYVNPQLPNCGCIEPYIAPLSVYSGCNNIQEIATPSCINIPEVISCNQKCDNFGYQGSSNPFASSVINAQQNVPSAPQIFGLLEPINCNEIASNNYGVQEYITPVAQTYITQGCQNEVPVIPAYFLNEVTDCSTCLPEVTCLPEISRCSFESRPIESCLPFESRPIELCLPQRTDFSYAFDIPKRAEIFIPPSMPAQLWVDPDSLPNICLSIDPKFGGSYGC